MQGAIINNNIVKRKSTKSQIDMENKIIFVTNDDGRVNWLLDILVGVKNWTAYRVE